MNESWGYDGLLGSILGGAFGGIATDPRMAQQTSEVQLADTRAAMNRGARNAWMPPELSREEEARKVSDAATAYATRPDYAFWYWLCALVAVAGIWTLVVGLIMGR